MRKNVRNTLIVALLYTLFINSGHAFDMDETVNDEIRKNYNPGQLVNDIGIMDSPLEIELQEQSNKTYDSNLPELPNISKDKKEQLSTSTNSKPQVYQTYTGGNIKIKKGTSFNVISNGTISDWQRAGTKVKFTLRANTFTKNLTIPAGTIFNGEIIESHRPQISCNGGLIVIKVDSMIYKNTKVPIIAYITRANDKKIFFNNIKGNRTYLKTTWQKGNWGRTLFNKMLTVSIGLGGEGSTLILSPFPFAYGTICLGVNAITSPICAFFSKGDTISIPSGSPFRIKLIEDVMVN